MVDGVKKKRARGKRGGKQASQKKKELLNESDGPAVETMEFDHDVQDEEMDNQLVHDQSTHEQPPEQDGANEEPNIEKNAQRKANRRGKRAGKKKENHQKEYVNDDVSQMQESYTENEEAPTYNDYEGDANFIQEQPEAPANGGYWPPDFDFVPTETLNYFTSIENLLDEPPFQTDEEMIIFLRNVYKEAQGNYLSLAADATCSKIVEKLAQFSSDVQLRELLHGLSGNLFDVARHRFASHVLQTLLNLAPDILEREMVNGIMPKDDDEESDNQQEIPGMTQLIISLCEELSKSWIDAARDEFGSHIVRTILNVLSGGTLVEDEDLLRSKRSQGFAQMSGTLQENQANQYSRKKHNRKVPPQFEAILTGIADNLMNQLDEQLLRLFCYDRVVNPILQILVTIKETGVRVIDMLLAIDEENDTGDGFVGGLIRDKVGSHLMEKVIEFGPQLQFHHMYVRYFRNNLQELARHEVANFVVQRLVSYSRNAIQLEMLIEELEPAFAEYLLHQRAGVVAKIAEACTRFESCQGIFIIALLKAFQAEDGPKRKEIFKSILLMRNPEREYKGIKYDYLGAQCLENILKFSEAHVKIICDSFLSLPTNETSEWIFNPIGSRAYENVISCKNMPLKAKKKILHGLKGKLVAIAKDKYGSHLMDKFWQISDVAMKEQIASELLEAQKALESSYHGKFVVRNCRLDQFRRKKDEWLEREQGINKKKEMFKEFMTEPSKTETISKTQVDEEHLDPEIEALWKSTKYNDQMAILGVLQPSSSAKKVPQNAGVHDDGEVKVGKGVSQEIDEMFRSSKKRKETDSDDIEEEIGTKNDLPQRTTDKGLSEVLDILASDSKKHKKQKKSEGKKKKKFES